MQNVQNTILRHYHHHYLICLFACWVIFHPFVVYQLFQKFLQEHYQFLFVCFVALRPKSTAMVMAGRSVHLGTLFPGQAWTSSYPVLHAHTFACNWQQPFLNDSAEGRRMNIEIISWSISTKEWDRAGIKLATPGSAVRLASVARHVTDSIKHYQCQTVWIQIRTNNLSVLIWLQTVCKGYQQMTKVAACKEFKS